jgi:D-glycero-alpha-D-manno-heptose-7-phosphate kinase
MIISRAPVRISFFGGGTDYPEYFREHGGAVLATAIDKYSYVTVSPFLSHLFDYSIRISYRQAEVVKSVDEIRHNVYRECLKLCGLNKDVELHNLADLPAFTGLGSSSAFTVSLLHALNECKA